MPLLPLLTENLLLPALLRTMKEVAVAQAPCQPLASQYSAVVLKTREPRQSYLHCELRVVVALDEGVCVQGRYRCRRWYSKLMLLLLPPTEELFLPRPPIVLIL